MERKISRMEWKTINLLSQSHSRFRAWPLQKNICESRVVINILTEVFNINCIRTLFFDIAVIRLCVYYANSEHISS